jgi:hypothetical protein
MKGGRLGVEDREPYSFRNTGPSRDGDTGAQSLLPAIPGGGRRRPARAPTLDGYRDRIRPGKWRERIRYATGAPKRRGQGTAAVGGGIVYPKAIAPSDVLAGAQRSLRMGSTHHTLINSH